MKLRVLLLVLSGLLTGHSAAACSYIEAAFDDQIESAEVAFIGSVRVDEEGLVIFDVEKPIRGVEEGSKFSVEEMRTSCGIDFSPGQVWLYLGAHQISGSRLLVDEFGRILEAYAAQAFDKFAFDAKTSRAIAGGTLKDSCAPWDGAAFELSLDNGVRVTVYQTLEDLSAGVRSFDIGGGERMGGGVIHVCEDGNENCEQFRGRLYFGRVNADEASGQVEIHEGEHKRTHVFRVKKLPSKAFCG